MLGHQNQGHALRASAVNEEGVHHQVDVLSSTAQSDYYLNQNSADAVQLYEHKVGRSVYDFP